MNTFRKIVTVVTVLFAVNLAAANDVPIKFSELPQKAQTFVKTHFSESITKIGRASCRERV